MKKTLIIGGGGFIGTEVTRLLSNSDREIAILGRRKSPPERLPGNCRYIAGDLQDGSLLEKVLSPGMEVVDLACSTVPKNSFENPAFDLVTNLIPNLTLLQNAADIGIERLLVVSSGGAVYGMSNCSPIDENHKTEPVSPYGVSKLAIELYAKMFFHTSNLPIVIARPSNAYGHNQKPRFGMGFIAAAIDAAIKGNELEIFGPSGGIRDYIHVDDVASGIVAILQFGRFGEEYNIGTGVGYSSLEVVDLINSLDLTGAKRIRVRSIARRPFDVDSNILDSSKLRMASGWRPITDLAEGIRGIWKIRSTNRANLSYAEG